MSFLQNRSVAAFQQRKLLFFSFIKLETEHGRLKRMFKDVIKQNVTGISHNFL